MTLPPQHEPFRVAALYRFCRLERFEELRAPLAAFCCGRGIKGTLLLAQEHQRHGGWRQTASRADRASGSDAGIRRMEVKRCAADELPFNRMRCG
jgi:UPF0176 protein